MSDFLDCSSLSFSYDIMGVTTINYTIVHDTESAQLRREITAGGHVFSGYISNISTMPVPNTEGWFETNVTLVATTN